MISRTCNATLREKKGGSLIKLQAPRTEDEARRGEDMARPRIRAKNSVVHRRDANKVRDKDLVRPRRGEAPSESDNKAEPKGGKGGEGGGGVTHD